MTSQELGKVLHDMYTNADEGESVAMIHLFGIKYADEINRLDIAKRTLAIAAGINPSYGTEISKGMKLSKYVLLK